jgi:hypothetical protein
VIRDKEWFDEYDRWAANVKPSSEIYVNKHPPLTPAQQRKEKYEQGLRNTDQWDYVRNVPKLKGTLRSAMRRTVGVPTDDPQRQRGF